VRYLPLYLCLVLVGCSSLDKKKPKPVNPVPSASNIESTTEKLDSIVGSAQISNKKASELIDIALELSKKASK
jgi:hypothetical protein